MQSRQGLATSKPGLLPSPSYLTHSCYSAPTRYGTKNDKLALAAVAAPSRPVASRSQTQARHDAQDIGKKNKRSLDSTSAKRRSLQNLEALLKQSSGKPPQQHGQQDGALQQGTSQSSSNSQQSFLHSPQQHSHVPVPAHRTEGSVAQQAEVIRSHALVQGQPQPLSARSLASHLGIPTPVGRSLLSSCPELQHVNDVGRLRGQLAALADVLAVSMVDAVNMVSRQPSMLTASPSLLSAQLSELGPQLGVTRGQLGPLVARQPEMLETSPDRLAAKADQLAALLCLPQRQAGDQGQQLLSAAPGMARELQPQSREGEHRDGAVTVAWQGGVSDEWVSQEGHGKRSKRPLRRQQQRSPGVEAYPPIPQHLYEQEEESSNLSAEEQAAAFQGWSGVLDAPSSSAGKHQGRTLPMRTQPPATSAIQPRQQSSSRPRLFGQQHPPSQVQAPQDSSEHSGWRDGMPSLPLQSGTPQQRHSRAASPVPAPLSSPPASLQAARGASGTSSLNPTQPVGVSAAATALSRVAGLQVLTRLPPPELHALLALPGAALQRRVLQLQASLPGLAAPPDAVTAMVTLCPSLLITPLETVTDSWGALQGLLQPHVPPAKVAGVLQRSPQLLLLAPEELQSSWAALSRVLGLGEDAGRLARKVAQQPNLLKWRPKALKAKLRELEGELGLSEEAVARLVASSPGILAQGADHLVAKLGALQGALGLEHDQVRRLVSRQPALLTQSASSFVRKLTALAAALALPHASVAEMVIVQPRLLTLSAHTVAARHASLAQLLGASPEEVAKTLVRWPSLLASPTADISDTLAQIAWVLEARQQQVAPLARAAPWLLIGMVPFPPQPPQTYSQQHAQRQTPTPPEPDPRHQHQHQHNQAPPQQQAADLPASVQESYRAPELGPGGAAQLRAMKHLVAEKACEVFARPGVGPQVVGAAVTLLARHLHRRSLNQAVAQQQGGTSQGPQESQAQGGSGKGCQSSVQVPVDHLGLPAQGQGRGTGSSSQEKLSTSRLSWTEPRRWRLAAVNLIAVHPELLVACVHRVLESGQ